MDRQPLIDKQQIQDAPSPSKQASNNTQKVSDLLDDLFADDHTKTQTLPSCNSLDNEDENNTKGFESMDAEMLKLDQELADVDQQIADHQPIVPSGTSGSVMGTTSTKLNVTDTDSSSTMNRRNTASPSAFNDLFSGNDRTLSLLPQPKQFQQEKKHKNVERRNTASPSAFNDLFSGSDRTSLNPQEKTSPERNKTSSVHEKTSPVHEKDAQDTQNLELSRISERNEDLEESIASRTRSRRKSLESSMDYSLNVSVSPAMDKSVDKINVSVEELSILKNMEEREKRILATANVSSKIGGALAKSKDRPTPMKSAMKRKRNTCKFFYFGLLTC